MTFLAVVPAGFFDDHTAFNPRDVASFAAQLRFADVAFAEWRGELVRGQEIGMVGKKFPENGEQTFVAE